MLSIVAGKRNKPRTSAKTTIPTMDIQQHFAKPRADRENIAHRQRSSEQAHIRRFQKRLAHQDRTSRIENQLPSHWTRGDKVSIKMSMEEDSVADKTQKQVAARITVANKKVQRTVLVANAEDNSDVTTKMTSNSSSNRDKSSPEPESDKRSSSSETDQTSHCESDGGKTALKLSKVLMLLNGEHVKLQDELGSVKHQLSEEHSRYESLEQKYTEQRSQRVNDKHLVDHWAQEAADARFDCEEVEGAKQVLKDRLADAKEQHRIDLEAKDREIETLKAMHDLNVAAKDVEIEKWHQACMQKDSTFQKMVTKLVSERDETRAKAIREKGKIWATSRNKTDDLKEKLEALKTKYDRMSADCVDATTKNKETIVNLVTRNQQLELEHGTMCRMLQQTCTQGSELHQLNQIIEASTASREEAKELRTMVKRLEQYNENLLDTLQNIQNECKRHRESEQDMRAASKRAHDTVQLLEDKLALTKIQLRDAANQLEKIQQGAVPAGAHCAALDALEQENEHLRESLQAERNDKAEMQGKLDKLDSENLNLSIEYDSIDAELIQSKRSSSTLHDSMKAAMHELNMLRKVVQGQQGALGEQDHSELLRLVSRTTEENKSLVESNARMEAKVQEVEQYGATIEDKSESEVMKAKDLSDYWWHLYHNEAVPTTERLHAEIAALKAEKGEQHFVEPAPPMNPVVFDRKMLPCAAMNGLAGVPAHLITSAVCDAEGVTHLSATIEALQTLRPQGWQPVVVAGKVWLSKIVKPLVEDDAVMQIQIGHHNGDLSSTGPGQFSMSDTYRSRNTQIPTNSMAYNGLSAHRLKLLALFLTNTSSKQAQDPVIPKRGNQVAARREARRPTTKQALKSKPQAAYRTAQASTMDKSRVPEWRASWLKIDSRMTREAWEDEDLDDDFKVNWVRLYVTKKDD
ncbi:hypothetical protein CUC08_Gglean006868 [Alternaria sp. MG1]|jgi:hypothetical protein|nr:hypothetical protein CUC08_Gglean006868 [Alternaria sp. MG1]